MFSLLADATNGWDAVCCLSAFGFLGFLVYMVMRDTD